MFLVVGLEFPFKSLSRPKKSSIPIIDKRLVIFVLADLRAALFEEREKEPSDILTNSLFEPTRLLFPYKVVF